MQLQYSKEVEVHKCPWSLIKPYSYSEPTSLLPPEQKYLCLIITQIPPCIYSVPRTVQCNIFEVFKLLKAFCCYGFTAYQKHSQATPLIFACFIADCKPMHAGKQLRIQIYRDQIKAMY